MTVTIIELLLSLAAILGAAVLFTNSVEILGQRLNLGQGAVGSILAAVGTALPETMIPVVALIGAAFSGESAGAAAAEIGIGAILGAPFLLATLGMFVVGASVLGFRRRRENGTKLAIHKSVARRDKVFFLICFSIAAAAGIVALPFFAKAIVAIILVGAYAVHVYRTIKGGEGGAEEAPSDLTFWPESRWGQSPTWAVVGQFVLSLGVMVGGARIFVLAVEEVSSALGVSAGLISLVLAPLATELPEKLNSAIWVRDGKDTLAFGNISGAMVFQSTIPVSLGLLFTPWELGFLNTLSVALAIIGSLGVLLLLVRKAPVEGTYLVGGGLLYAVFLAVAIYTLV